MKKEISVMNLSKSDKSISEFFLNNCGKAFTQEELVNKHYKELGYNSKNRNEIISDIRSSQLFEFFLHDGYYFQEVPTFKHYKLISFENEPIAYNDFLLDFSFLNEKQDYPGNYFERLRLLCSKEKLHFLIHQKQLYPMTVAKMEMGIDTNGNWLFPNFRYSTKAELELLGLDQLPLNFNLTCWKRTSKLPTCFLAINEYTSLTKALFIVKNHLDGYALWQHLNLNRIAKYYQIVFPANGLGTLLDCMKEIEFDKYQDFKIFIGNNKLESKIRDEILHLYPMFKNILPHCKCDSFYEHYCKYNQCIIQKLLNHEG